jgi:hypothetical protein
MLDEIKLILQTDLKEVIKSPLSLKLLKIYSLLYLGGGQPRCCERSQTRYYNQLQVDGIAKFKAMNPDLFTKTCELKADILIYISDLASHVTNANITDSIAIEGLKKGWFKESQFVKLPMQNIEVDEVKENQVIDLQETEQPKKVIQHSQNLKKKFNR